jgi:hypothetical protein
LPRVGGRFALFQTLRLVLADAAKRAGCADTMPITPHRGTPGPQTCSAVALACPLSCN